MIQEYYYDIVLGEFVLDARIVEYLFRWESYAYPWTENDYEPWSNILEEVK